MNQPKSKNQHKSEQTKKEEGAEFIPQEDGAIHVKEKSFGRRRRTRRLRGSANTS